jgi:hypothetical protein
VLLFYKFSLELYDEVTEIIPPFMNLKFNFIDAVQLKQTKVVRAKSCLSSSKPKQKKRSFLKYQKKRNRKRKEIEKETFIQFWRLQAFRFHIQRK